jgi:enoyl-CoA hydratase/carnithine racemase
MRRRESLVTLHVKEAARHVALISIDNQPKRNALSRAAMGDLAEAWERLGASEDCRCIVITGAGDKAFCSGADIGGDLSAREETARMIDRALLKTKVYPKPIVAAVNGDCAGGGVELLLSTDIRLTAEHARFGLPEVRWSIYPFGGATVKLAQQIGYVHAMDLLLTGRLVTAEFAARIGLVNRVLPAGDVLTASIETASAIATNSPPPFRR